MIDQLSPATRRFVAIGLLVLAVLLTVQLVVVPVASAIAERRSRLVDISAERARLAIRADRQLPKASTMPPTLVLTASTAALAKQQLPALLQGSARVAGIAVVASSPPTTATRSNLVETDVTVAGSEAAVMGFVSLAEHGAPAIRFARWSITASPVASGSEPSIRFSGVATAAWRPR